MLCSRNISNATYVINGLLCVTRNEHRFSGIMLRGLRVCWDLWRVAPYDVHGQLDLDVPVGATGSLNNWENKVYNSDFYG